MRLGFAQMNPLVGDISGNTDKIIDFIEKARERHVNILVFPELCITGYPTQDLIFISGFVQQNLDALNRIKRHVEEISVIIGHVEPYKDMENKFYNSATIITDGKIIGKVRKQLLPNYDVFDELRYFVGGMPTGPIEIHGKQVGVIICEDLWDEGYRRKVIPDLVSKGAEILISINASPYYKEKWKVREDEVRKKVNAHHVPFVYVNMVGGQDDITFDGTSFVMDGDGRLVFRAPPFMEGLHECQIPGTRHGFKSIPVQEIHEMSLLEEEIFKALCLNLRDYYNKIGVFNGILIGLSGGIDSAFTTVVAVKAIGADRVRCIYMPTRFNASESGESSRKLCENLGCEFITFPIEDIFNQYRDDFSHAMEDNTFTVADENLQARIRANILMYYSNKYNLLLVSTGNKSEISTGYCTLYGDTCGGKNIPGDLFKTELIKICNLHINKEREIIPRFIIERPPSAELRENQKDEDSLPPYHVLDKILEPMIEDFKSPADIVAMGFDEKLVEKVQYLVKVAEFKRAQLVQTIKITPKAFGIGRRMPITNGYRYT
ncbi:NAD+ synthase [Candidatus Bathyarchaeota archaeon]|nr:NAD+ synthase [Candidatus Bathyarchaeota archaeon]